MNKGNKLRAKLAVLGIFISVNVFLWLWSPVHSTGFLTVSFLDVGQGDAIFIEAPNGNQVLIDGGPNKQVLERLSEQMPYADRSIDIVIATHPDKDHIGGLPAVFDAYAVSYVFDSGFVSDTSIYHTYDELIARNNIEKIYAKAGMRIDLDSDVYLDILHPYEHESIADSNDASIVARLVYGDTEVLLTGDASKSVERMIMVSGHSIASDILKVGHHGSKTSTLPAFVEEVSPQYAIISAGARNSYGHPAREVLDILVEAGVEILETSKEGSITFISDGTHFMRK